MKEGGNRREKGSDGTWKRNVGGCGKAEWALPVMGGERGARNGHYYYDFFYVFCSYSSFSYYDWALLLERLRLRLLHLRVKG